MIIGDGCSGLGSGILSLEDFLIYWYAAREKKRLNKYFLKIPFTHTLTYSPSDDPYILELGKRCDRGEILESEGASRGETPPICETASPFRNQLSRKTAMNALRKRQSLMR